MKRKKLIIILVVIAIIISTPFAYVGFGKRTLRLKTYEYLTAVQGYKEQEFEIKNPRHSFINRILSYPEWGIDVIFKDEPDETYVYTYDPKDGSIMQFGGVGGKHYEED